ncbi:MAG: hypothetical protein ACRBB0_15205 [Pelagimonas sp.]|uniref:hypothetical protein n=1 Tax=Pelagimonas sp. TaxID=2073170 RepID=UPI003D6A5141
MTWKVTAGQYEGVMMKTTNGVAIGGITLPAWLPALETASQVAAHMVPILSAVWLVIQILGYIRKRVSGQDTVKPPKAKAKT